MSGGNVSRPTLKLSSALASVACAASRLARSDSMFCRNWSTCDKIDQAGLLIGFQQAQRADLQAQAVLGVADLLQLLHQAQESADRAGAAARQTRRAVGRGGTRRARRH